MFCSADLPLPHILGMDRKITVAGLQRIMVQTMNAAHAVPHFGFCEEIAVDNLIQVCLWQGTGYGEARV